MFHEADSTDRCLAIVQMTATLAGGLVDRPDFELRAASAALAARLAHGQAPDQDAATAEALALYAEASRRGVGRALADEEIFAAAAMCTGVAPALSRGLPGCAGMAAYWYSLPGKGVHILEGDQYLAQRDVLSYAEVLRTLGRQIVLLTTGMSDTERRRAYAADITIAHFTEFMDDCLRDSLPISGRQPVQRRYAAVVGNASVAVGQAVMTRAMFAPRAEVSHIVRGRRHLDLDSGVARVVSVDGTEPVGGVVRLNSRGIAALADEFNMPAFSPGFVLAAEDVISCLQSDKKTIYLSIALFAYLKKYGKLACAAWSIEEDAADLQRMYGLSIVRFRDADAVSPEPLVVLAGPSQRLDAVLDRVAQARQRGLPVIVCAIRQADAEACAVALAARAWTSTIVRPGRELESFVQTATASVTIVGPNVTMPESPADTAYLAFGAGPVDSFVEWCRIASGSAFAWVVLAEDDPLVSSVDPEVVGALHRLPKASDGSELDGQRRAVGAALYDSARTLAQEDRLIDWAFRSLIEEHAERFYELRRFIASANHEELVRRLVDEYVSDFPDAAAAFVAVESELVDATAGVDDDWARARLAWVYDEIRLRSDSSVPRPNIRDTMMYFLGDVWCRFLRTASFLRLHLSEAYPAGSNRFAEYKRDLAGKFSEAIRDFRRDTVRSILSKGGTDTGQWTPE